MKSRRRPNWLSRQLYPFEDQWMEIDGHTLHYVDEGAGPVLLLLHGNPTWSFLYRGIIRRLRDTFRCVAADYPGFGLSTARAGYGFTTREHSAVVEKLFLALDLRDVTLVVQDWGGPIGLGLAGRQSDRISALRSSPHCRVTPAETARVSGRNSQLFAVPHGADAGDRHRGLVDEGTVETVGMHDESPAGVSLLQDLVYAGE